MSIIFPIIAYMFRVLKYYKTPLIVILMNGILWFKDFKSICIETLWLNFVLNNILVLNICLELKRPPPQTKQLPKILCKMYYKRELMEEGDSTIYCLWHKTKWKGNLWLKCSVKSHIYQIKYRAIISCLQPKCLPC